MPGRAVPPMTCSIWGPMMCQISAQHSRPRWPSALGCRSGSHGLAIGIIIELDEFGTPPDEHRVVGVEQHAHRRAQALRPGLRRPQRTLTTSRRRASKRPFPRRRRESPQNSDLLTLQHEGNDRWHGNQSEISSRNSIAVTGLANARGQESFKYISPAGNKTPRRATHHRRAHRGAADTCCRLFHEAGGSERARDDGCRHRQRDVRLTGRLGGGYVSSSAADTVARSGAADRRG